MQISTQARSTTGYAWSLLLFLPSADGTGNVGTHDIQRTCRVDDDCIGWPFQRRQLAPEQLGMHEMPPTLGQPLPKDRGICGQQNEMQGVRDACAQPIANELRQRGARNERVPPWLTRIDPGYQGLDPRRSVLVRKRRTPGHLLHVVL